MTTRGVAPKHEKRRGHYVRDLRPSISRWADSLRNSKVAAAHFVGLAALTWLIPEIADIGLMIGGLTFTWLWTLSFKLPLKMPKQCGRRDPRDRMKAAAGILYLGNDLETEEQLWLSDDDARTHMGLFGTTGAGKTEMILSFLANALSWGSGAVLVDGKGDISLWAKVVSMARKFGRDDDVRIINFMTGARDLRNIPPGQIYSNTFNPFAKGSSDMLTEMFVSLMDEAGGEGAMWKGRAEALARGLFSALTSMRDRGEIQLYAQDIIEYSALGRIVELTNRTDLPEIAVSSLKAYLQDLPGFDPAKGANQGDQTRVQHGFLTMQYTKILGLLNSTYRHIFNVEVGEIDFSDVVLNRRIVVILLPSLEKAPDSLASLGRIIVAAEKGMMASTLGSDIEGSREHVVDNRPTNSDSPFLNVFDEVGYYCVAGMAIMAAQARSLGFWLIYAAQDLAAMMRQGKEEPKSIVANCNTKVIGKLEDPEETFDMVRKVGGKALVAAAKSFDGETGMLADATFRDTLQAQMEEIDRVDWLDLKSQQAGQTHVMYSDVLSRAQMFYANVNVVPDIRANHFVRIRPPTPEQIAAGDTGRDTLFRRLVTPGFRASTACPVRPPSPTIAFVASKIATATGAGIECGCAILSALSTRSCTSIPSTAATSAPVPSVMTSAPGQTATPMAAPSAPIDPNESFDGAAVISAPLPPPPAGDDASLTAAAAAAFASNTAAPWSSQVAAPPPPPSPPAPSAAQQEINTMVDPLATLVATATSEIEQAIGAPAAEAQQAAVTTANAVGQTINVPFTSPVGSDYKAAIDQIAAMLNLPASRDEARQ